MLVHTSQHVAAKRVGDRLHLGRYGGVIRRQIRVIAPGVHDTKGKTAPRHVKIDLLYHRRCGIGKIQRADTAHGDGELIKKPAGLAEEFVLGKFGDLCQCDGINAPFVVKSVLDRSYQDLKCGGGGKARALRHVGGGIGIKAACGKARVGKSARDARNEGIRVRIAVGAGREKGIEIDRILAVSVGKQGDDVSLDGGCHGNYVRIHGGGQRHTVIVIGVIARELATSRDGKKRDLPRGAEAIGKGADGIRVTNALCGKRLFAVQCAKARIKRAFL